ncbi:MAG: double-strand break repair protein AddB [Pseudorhodoplanes sp.]|uniref:double-strand break repair protein AddB n=1 Tax=Pseudorhodoplanes sp. TaxID=1934341 RepID=UPI003D098323
MASREPRLFTLPSSVPFLPALIEALLAGRLVDGFPGSRDPMTLAQATLYLPTRRACRLARDVFLSAGGGDAAILPRLVPIGDIDEDEIIFAEFAGGPLAPERLRLARAMDPFDRKALLTQMILKWAAAQKRGGEASLIANSPTSAFAMAGELARLHDDMITRGMDGSALDMLVPREMDEYFSSTLDFLRIVREHWPKLLEEQGLMDATARRDALIDAEAARLARDGAGPVIAAGSTASMPSTAKLLAAIARLPNGAVVLPGLDTGLDEPSWEAIGGTKTANPAPGHPQFSMQGFLRGLGVKRDRVEVLVASAAHGRERLASEAMRPAEATDRWRDTLTDPAFEQDKATALAGLSLIEAAITEEEAIAVALALREGVADGSPECEGRTAALITPDRALARRVRVALERWDVPVDDSGGDPLSETPAGVFARLAAEAALNGCEPVTVLALLKHPLCRLGQHQSAHRPAIALLERAILRGPRPRAGAEGLEHALQNLRAERETLHARDPRRRLSDRDLSRAIELVGKLKPALEPLAALRTAVPLREVAVRHHAVVAALSLDQKGQAAALMERDGSGLADTFQTIIDSGQAAAFLVDMHDYADLFRVIASDRVVRRPGAPGARVRIYGPLEARLQQADRVVLAGLVEGVWPPEPHNDAWLNRPMRQELGLDLPERRIGLSAHDFTQALGAREVILSHAAKREGSPTVESRFVRRLAAVAGPEAWDTVKQRGAKYLDWARALDRPAEVKAAERPEPRPPVAVRPKRLPVTDIEHWLRDPYTIYAKHILRLQALDPIDTPPGARDRGTVIHKAIGDFTARFADRLPDEPLEELMALGRDAFAPLNDFPEAKAFWWPRFARIARWFVDWEIERRKTVQSVYAEVQGKLQVTDDFLLTARADRIEMLKDGSFAVLDYKTGQPPTQSQVESGLAPQLTLQATIVQHGQFEGVPKSGLVSELMYLRLKGGDPSGESIPRGFKNMSVDQAADRALTKLHELVTKFALEETAYLSFWRPMWVGRTYGDFDHLARVREWSATGGEEDPDIPT